MNIQWKPVINYSSGRAGYKPEAIIIHIAEGTLQGGYTWFNNASSQVSSHYMLGKNGEIWQFVRDEDTAWHAGGINKPNWNLLKSGVNPNLYTIGIEHEGFTGQPFTEQMTKSLVELLYNVCRKFSIPADRNHIIGHNKINSVSRSQCPGSGVNLDHIINLVNDYIDPAMEKALRDQIAQLEALTKTLQNKVNNLDSEKTALMLQVNMLAKQLDELTKHDDKLATLQRQNKLLVDEVGTLQTSQSNLNKKVLALEEENKDLKNQLKKSGSPIIDTIRNLLRR